MFKNKISQCYKCDSKQGDCSEDSYGEPGDCSKNTGCSLSLGDGVFLRTCGDSESDFNCATTDEGGMVSRTNCQFSEPVWFQSLKYCNCQTELCNKNWETAAGSGGERVLGGIVVIFACAFFSYC